MARRIIRQKISKIFTQVFRLAFIQEILFPFMHKLYRWDFTKLTMVFQSSRVLSLISTHRDSWPYSTANSTGSRYRYTGPLHYMKCIERSRLVGAIGFESLNKLRLGNFLSIHPGIFTEYLSTLSPTILVLCIVATHYSSSSSNLDLRNPGGEVGTTPPGTGLEAAGPRLEWRRSKPGIARVM